MATGFGLRLVGRIGGGDAKVREYYVPATNGTALFEGDVVTPAAGMDPANEVGQVTQFAVTNVETGVVLGFKPLPAYPYTAYRQASVAQYVEVCDDPLAIYAVQEDAVGGAVSAANIGSMYYASLIVAAGSTALGLSGTMLDSSTAQASATGMDVQIIGVLRSGVNAGAQTGGAILLVRFINPAL